MLYEGNPFHPGPERLWQIAEAEKISIFGTSAKYIDAVKNAGYVPRDNTDLGQLKTLLSTGSPLSADGFDFVYEHINRTFSSAQYRAALILSHALCLAVRCNRSMPAKFKHAGLGCRLMFLTRPATASPAHKVNYAVPRLFRACQSNSE